MNIHNDEVLIHVRKLFPHEVFELRCTFAVMFRKIVMSAKFSRGGVKILNLAGLDLYHKCTGQTPTRSMGVL